MAKKDKSVYSVWNNQGVCYEAFRAKNRTAALKQMQRKGYYLRNGFRLLDDCGN